MPNALHSSLWTLALAATAAAQLPGPVAFEPNAGRWPAAVLFHGRAGAVDAWVARDALVWSLAEPSGAAAALRWTFAGADALDARGEEQRCERRTWLRGSGASSTERLWERVRCAQVAPGVDLVLRSGDGALEYDLELAPRARLDELAIRCEGHEALFVDAEGALVIETALGALRQPAPLAWQVTRGEARPLAVRYRVLDERTFGFEAPARDGELAALIDPAVRWASYLSGSADQTVAALASGPNGTTVVAGTTQSIDFPTTLGAFDLYWSGGDDAFVACFSADGARLEWSTMLGGLGDDEALTLAVDPSGTVTVGGDTRSADFPASIGALDTTLGGAQDAFVARLAPDGASLVWGTYVGGAQSDRCGALALDASSGDVLLVGTTRGAGFPVTAGAFDTSYNGGPVFGDAFALRLSSDGASAVWSTFLGSAGDEFGERVALAPNGDVALSGLANSAQFPTTPGAYDSLFQGPDEPFVARLSADGSSLLGSTFLGTAGGQAIRALAIAPDGNTLCVGETRSGDLPIAPTALDRRFAGPSEGFVAEVTPDARRLGNSSYFGGSGEDAVVAAAYDAQGELVIAGDTASFDLFTTPGAYDRDANALPGNPVFDLFVARLRADLMEASYSTYFGGPGPEHLAGLALDAGGAVLLAGTSAGAGFPTSSNAFQPAWNVVATRQGFAARLALLLHPIPYGRGKLNSQGSVGAMRWSGFPSASEQTFQVGLDNALAGAWSSLYMGFAPAHAPFAGALLLVRPPFVRLPRFKTDFLGYAERPFPLDPAWAGQTLYFQVWYEDAGDPYGGALTDALRVLVYP